MQAIITSPRRGVARRREPPKKERKNHNASGPLELSVRDTAVDGRLPNWAAGNDDSCRGRRFDLSPGFPWRGNRPTKYPAQLHMLNFVAVRFWLYTTAKVAGSDHPRRSRNRLFPSQGIRVFVWSNPAATSNGLWARL